MSRHLKLLSKIGWFKNSQNPGIKFEDHQSKSNNNSKLKWEEYVEQ